MALPEQVRLQSEAAAKLIKDLTDEGGEPATPAVVLAAPAADSALVVVPPAQVTEPPAVVAPAADDFEQKYKSLQGMYNADLPKAQAELRAERERTAQLEALMATLQTVPNPTTVSAAQKLVTEADVSEYGESIEMMRKVSREEIHPLLAKIGVLETALNNMATSLNTSVLPQVRHVAQQQNISAEDRFWNDLQREVPDWQKTNNDPDFKSWLLTVDPMTGTTPQSFLEQAQSKLDANRVIAFFRSYATATGKPLATPTLAQPKGSASELESQLAPGRSRGGAPPVNPTVKTYSPEDIKKFYEDVRKGVYRGREAERNQIEAAIFAANKNSQLVATS